MWFKVWLYASHNNSSFYPASVFCQSDIVSPKLLKNYFGTCSERLNDKFFRTLHILYMQSF